MVTYLRRFTSCNLALALALLCSCKCYLSHVIDYGPLPQPLSPCCFCVCLVHWTLNIFGFTLPIDWYCYKLINHHRHGYVYVYYTQLVIAQLQASDTGQFAKFGQLIYRFQCYILKLHIGICNLLKLSFAISILPIKILRVCLIDNYYRYTYTKNITNNKEHSLT